MRAIPAEDWRPLRMLCADFTEIPYRGGKAYLIPYLDAVGKRICGYAFSAEQTTALALTAYRKAKQYFKRKGISPGNTCVHQDQGTQFTGYGYVGALANG